VRVIIRVPAIFGISWSYPTDADADANEQTHIHIKIYVTNESVAFEFSRGNQIKDYIITILT